MMTKSIEAMMVNERNLSSNVEFKKDNDEAAAPPQGNDVNWVVAHEARGPPDRDFCAHSQAYGGGEVEDACEGVAANERKRSWQVISKYGNAAATALCYRSMLCML